MINLSLTLSAGSTNATLINQAIQTLGTLGGGTVKLPCGSIHIASSIIISVSNVSVVGCGGSNNLILHMGSPTNTPATSVVPDSNFTPLIHRTNTPATSIIQGGGFRDLTVIDNGVVTSSLEWVRSAAGFDDRVTFAGNLASPQLLMDTCTTTTDLVDACDVRGAVGSYAFLIGSGATIPFQLTGSSNANVSFNDFTFRVRNNGTAPGQMVSTDNNTFAFYCIASPTPCVEFYGPTAAHPVGSHGNTIRYMSGASGIDAQGTDTSGVLAGITNMILRLDTENSTPIPTAGTGSNWSYFDSFNAVRFGGLPASAGTGGLYVCADSKGTLYRKSTCP